MLTRNRSYSLPGTPGTNTWNGVTTNYRQQSPFGTMLDVVGNPMGENPLDASSVEVSGGMITGSYVRLGIPGTANYPASCTRSYSGSHLVVPNTFQPAATAVAAAHPGEPLVDIPVFLVELRDIPEMYKHAFRRAKTLSNAAKSKSLRGVRRYLQNPRNPSEDWLNWHFGWSPLLSDLFRLAGVAGDMQRRARMHRNASNNVITRRSNLGSSSAQSVTNQSPYDSTVTSWWGSRTKTTHQTQWVVSHWRQDPTYLSASLFSQQAQLFRAALGLEFSIDQAWELMPWSWMVDWFSEIGSVIKTRSNRAGITFKNASYMTYTETKEVVIPWRPPLTGLSGSPAVFKRETKSRTPYAPSILSGFVNIYSSSQLATIASLAITRAR